MDFSSFNTTTVSNVSMSNQQNILRDNYSLDEIFEKKLQESVRLASELENLYDNDSLVVPENTIINFTTMVKDKNSIAMSLCDVVTNSEPFAYPNYRAEAYMKLTENLANEEQYLQELEKDLKEKRNEYSLKNQAMSDVYKQLQVVMEAAHSSGRKTTTDPVMVKLAQNMLDDSKKLLLPVLETIFPGNYKAVIEILGELEKANKEVNEEQRWMKCNNMDTKIVDYLLQAHIIKQHPQDREKIKLYE